MLLGMLCDLLCRLLSLVMCLYVMLVVVSVFGSVVLLNCGLVCECVILWMFVSSVILIVLSRLMNVLSVWFEWLIV